MLRGTGGEAAPPFVPRMRSARAALAVTLGLDGDWTPGPYAPEQDGLMPEEPRRPPVHRVLRLIMTAGAVAAGLCLIVGMVLMVAAAGGTGHAGSGTGSGSRSGGSQLTPPPHTGAHGQAGVPDSNGHHPSMSPGSRYRVSRTLRVFKGQGTGEPGPFRIGKPGIWGLAWSYNCPPTRPGNFVLGETRTWIGFDVTQEAQGTWGQGLYWVTGDAGKHSLVVVSQCHWQLRVVLPVLRS